MTNLIELLLSNVVELLQGVEAVHIDVTVGVHRLKRITR